MDGFLVTLGDTVGRRRSVPKKLGMLAREIYKARRLRDAVLPRLFGEPAWDILLDLFASEAEHIDVSVSSACLAAGVPATTAHRYLIELVT